MVAVFLASASEWVFVSVVVSGNPGQSQPVNLASAPPQLNLRSRSFCVAG